MGKHLVEICAFLHNQTALTVAHYQPETVPHEQQDLSDIIGQQQGRRALEITAAGGHNLLLLGRPAPVRPCWQPDCPALCRRWMTEALECAAIASWSAAVRSSSVA